MRVDTGWLVEASIAVSTPMAMAKTAIVSPATASQRRRSVGSPARSCIQRSRLQPVGPPAATTSISTVSSPGSMAGSESVAAGGLLGAESDQSARREALASRCNRCLVVCNEAMYRVEPTVATMLAIAAPIRVPATPKVEEMTAAETAARALAAT
jgi:hypothetical protein